MGLKSSQKTMAHYDFWHLSSLTPEALDTAPIIAIAHPKGPAIITVHVDDVTRPLNHPGVIRFSQENAASNVAGKSPNSWGIVND